MAIREPLLSGYLPPEQRQPTEQKHSLVKEKPLKDVLLASPFDLRLTNGLLFSSTEVPITQQEVGDVMHRIAEGSSLRPRIDMLIDTQTPDSYHLSLTLTNTTPHPLALESLTVFKTTEDSLLPSPDKLHAMQTGWQSWSLATHAEEIDKLPKEKHTPEAMKGPHLSPTDFPWMTMVKHSEHEYMLLGWTSAQKAVGMIHGHIENGQTSLEATYYPEGKVVQPGESFTTESLMVAKGQEAHQLLETYGDKVGKTMDATVCPTPPNGWTSWYEYFDRVPFTQDELHKQLDFITQHKLAIDYVQIDDGYQKAWGDWEPRGDKFPQGFAPVTEAIHKTGRKAGIWWSPFLVGEDSQLVQQHPEWLLKQQDVHQPLLARFLNNKHMFALDPTHPEVLAFLKETTEKFVKEYGFDYLKLDFLYAGMLEGKRYDSSQTSVEAYRHALGIIRQVAPDTILVGCGAPLLPSVGLVDAMRISSDTEFVWEEGPNLWKDRPGLHNVFRSIFAHSWMHNNLWTNDPDVFTLRDHDTYLTPDERLTLLTAVLLSGGSRFIGDNLELLEQEGLAQLPGIFNFPLTKATPLGPFTDGLPQKAVARLSPTTQLVAVFNWENAPQDYTVDTTIFPKQTHVQDVWGQKILSDKNACISLQIPPHGVKVLAISTGEKINLRFVGDNK